MAWTPPSTWTISPVVAGNQSESRSARRAAGTGSLTSSCFRPLVPHPLELLEARNRLGRRGADRPGSHQVAPHTLGAQVTRQIAIRRLERSLRHAHPVVDRPGELRVERQADDAAAVRHERKRSHRERLRL